MLFSMLLGIAIRVAKFACGGDNAWGNMHRLLLAVSSTSAKPRTPKRTSVRRPMHLTDFLNLRRRETPK